MSEKSRDARTVVGAACWVLGLEWFLGQAVAQAAWTTPYSLSANFISDLGAATCGQARLPSYHAYVCSPLHGVMNASFVLYGLLTLTGIVLLRPILPRRRLTTVALAFLSLFGLGKILVGLAPEDIRLGIHALGSLGIPCGNLGALLLGLAAWRATRWTAVVSLGVGAVGLVAFVLLAVAPIWASARWSVWPITHFPSGLPRWASRHCGLGDPRGHNLATFRIGAAFTVGPRRAADQRSRCPGPRKRGRAGRGKRSGCDPRSPLRT